MPVRRRTRYNRKRRSRRRSAKKRSYSQGNKVTSVWVPRRGIPDIFKTKLIFTKQIQLTGAAFNGALFHANSVFVPYPTTTANKPGFFPELANLYGRYVVTGCKAQVDYSVQNAIPTYVTLSFHDVDPSGFSGFQTIQQARFVKYATLGSINGMSVRRLTYYMGMKTLNGQKSIVNDPLMYSVVTSNPTDLTYCFVACNSTDNSTTSNVWCNVRLTYYVWFKEAFDQIAV